MKVIIPPLWCDQEWLKNAFELKSNILDENTLTKLITVRKEVGVDGPRAKCEVCGFINDMRRKLDENKYFAGDVHGL